MHGWQESEKPGSQIMPANMGSLLCNGYVTSTRMSVNSSCQSTDAVVKSRDEGIPLNATRYL